MTDQATQGSVIASAGTGARWRGSGARTRGRGLIAGLALVTLGAVGCSSSPATHPASGPTQASSGHAKVSPALVAGFKKAEAPPLLALRSQQTAFVALPSMVSGHQLRPVLAPLETATKQFDVKLAALPWPQSMRSDVANLVAANKKQLASYEKVTASGQEAKSEVLGALQTNFAEQQTVLNRVRADLGLAPL